jgi:hypothetical protein
MKKTWVLRKARVLISKSCGRGESHMVEGMHKTGVFVMNLGI